MSHIFSLICCCVFLCLQLAYSSTVKTYTAENGTIKTDLKDGYYLNNVEVIYDIKVQNGKRLMVSFKTFNVLGAMPNCTEDSLEIFVGCANKSIGKFCSCGMNSSKPFNIYSMDECVKLVFKTDSKIVGKGFEAVYSSFDKNQSVSNVRTCSNPDLHTSGNFFTPLWPNSYLPNTTCEWKLAIPTGHESQIYFMNFRIEDNHNCQPSSLVDDYVSIYASNGRNRTVIRKRMCSSYADETFSVPIGKYSMVYTKFFSDSDSVASVETGFAAGFVSYKKGFKPVEGGRCEKDEGIPPTGIPPTGKKPTGDGNAFSSTVCNTVMVLCFFFKMVLTGNNM